MLNRAVEGRMWVRMRDQRGRLAQCWSEVEPGDVPFELGAFTAERPGYISVLEGVEALDSRRSPGKILVTLRAGDVVSLLATSIEEELDLSDAEEDARVTATMRLRSAGDLESLLIRGPELVTALEERGASVPDEVRGPMQGTYIDIEYRANIAPVTVAAPPAELQSAWGEHTCGAISGT